MTSEQVLSMVQSAGITISLDPDGTLDLKPAALVTAYLKEQVRLHKAELVKLLTPGGRAEPLFGAQEFVEPEPVQTTTGLQRAPLVERALEREERKQPKPKTGTPVWDRSW